MRGEVIPANDLVSNTGLRLYGEVIFEDWKRDEATQQPDFFGEVYHQKVHPIEMPLTPEQEHLKRPSGEGRRQSEIEALDRNMEAMRITEIRKELHESRT